MMKTKYLIALAAVFAGITAYSGSTDMYMKMKVTQPDATEKNQTGQIREMWITPTKVRTNEGDQSSIFDLEKNILITIDHSKKKYMEIPLDFSGTSASGEQGDMSSLPGFMQKMMKMEVTVQPTGEEKTIGQWHCRKYLQTVKMAMGTTESEIWASGDIRINMDVYHKFSAALMASQPGFYKIFRDAMKENEKIKGVTVFQKAKSKVMGKSVETITELLEVSETEASADLFTVPAGYKMEKFKES